MRGVIVLGLCLGPVLVLRLCLLDRTKIVAAGADLLRMDDAAVPGFDAIAPRGDARVRRKKPGDLFGLLRSDTDNRAIDEQRAAKFALRAEQRQPHGSLGRHLLLLELGMLALI